MRVEKFQELISSGITYMSGDFKILHSKAVKHPLMDYLLLQLMGMSIVSTDKLNMSELFNHIKFLKEEYERGHGTRYPDVAMVYTHEDCCGHTIIVKKGEEEIRIRHNKLKANV